MGRKAVEMGRYGASELMRNKKLQKKAVNYGINKLTPFIQESVGSAMDQLSTKVRPNIKYKTDRKDLDGAGLIDSALTAGIFGSPFQADLKKGYKILTDPGLFAPVRKMPKKDGLALVKHYKDENKKAKANGYSKSYNSFVKEMGWGAGLDPMTVVKKAPDIAMSTTQELIPSLKPVIDRYKSGDIMKSAFGSDHGITSSKFWKRATAVEEKKMGIIRKGSNPELFFKFEKPYRRMYKTTFFEKNPEALTNMNNIISSNPDTWPQVLKEKYGIIVDEQFWENNPLLSFGSGFDIHKAILKVAPRKGFTLPGHNYTGPGNPLEYQLKYDPQTGEILEIYEQPTGRTDAVSMQHDVDYSVCGNKPSSEQVKCKNEADRKMIKALDAIPWKQRQWGHAMARTIS